MARERAVLFKENLPIPRDAFTLEGFRRWAASADFPETGRIDFLAGDVEVALSPEELLSHGLVKGAIYAGLYSLLSQLEIGEAFTDSTQYTSETAGLSTTPDVIVVLYDSLDTGRVCYRSLGRRPDRLTEIEGTADLVVDVVSDDSVTKTPSASHASTPRQGFRSSGSWMPKAATSSSGPTDCVKGATFRSRPTQRVGPGRNGCGTSFG